MSFQIPSRRGTLFVSLLHALTRGLSVKREDRAIGLRARSWVRGFLGTAAVCSLLIAALIAATWHIYSKRVAHDSALPVYRWGEIIRFDESDTGSRERAYLVQGWSAPDKGLTWILGSAAELAFQVDRPASTVLLDAAVVKNMAPGVPDQFVSISVNGRYVATPRVSARGRIQASLPADTFAPGRPIFVRFEITAADAGSLRQPVLALSWFRLSTDGPFAPLAYDTRILFSAGGRRDAALYLFAGWSEPDLRTSWLQGDSAAVAFRIPNSAEDAFLEVELKPLIAGDLRRQRLNISVNDAIVASLAIERESQVQLPLPQALRQSHGLVTVTFEAPDHRSPAALGLSNDRRELSFAFRSIVLRRGLLANAVVVPHRKTWLRSVRARFGLD